MHLNRKYFEKDPLIKIDDLFFDIKKKRLILEEAKNRSMHDSREIDYAADYEIIKRLSNMFIESNENLRRITNVNLPNEYFTQ